MFNILASSNSIVVYRSRAEQMQDEAWMDLVNNHPEVVLWGFGIFVALALLVIVVSIWPKRWTNKWN